MPTLNEQQLLLRMEYEHEREEYQRQNEAMGIARRVNEASAGGP